MRPLVGQSGYTLVELVIVIALSAVFVVMVIQNTATSQSTQQFVSAIEKVKSVVHDAETQGGSGEASSSNISGFLCGTRLRINPNGTYQIWRIYDSSDSGGGNMTYQSITGGVDQPFAPQNLDIQSVLSGPDPPINSDKSWSTAVSQTIDLVFLGASPSEPIGQAYVYTDPSSEPAQGVNGPADCSDFATAASSTNLLNVFFNIYSGTNHPASHFGTLVITTGSGSVRNQVLR